MVPAFLLPESALREDGAGARVALESCAGKSLTITLGITRIVERASLEVVVCGSRDGESWQPIASFPPKSYCGVYTVTVDLARIQRDVCYLRAQWRMSRWDQRSAKPIFDFYIFVEPLQTRVAGVA
jgi:hypothetical protein